MESKVVPMARGSIVLGMESASINAAVALYNLRHVESPIRRPRVITFRMMFR